MENAKKHEKHEKQNNFKTNLKRFYVVGVFGNTLFLTAKEVIKRFFKNEKLLF